MTRLAAEHEAINLAQGFPDFAAPDLLKEAAAKAIRADINQYAITWGAARLRSALAARYADWYGLEVDADREITITCGATEAMASTLLATVDPGEEVVVFEPFYENYGPDAILCDAKPVFVPLSPSGPLDLDRLRAAFSPRTRAIIVNTPNNPTGRVLSRTELEGIAELCQRYDAFAVTDEIYEHIYYEGEAHSDGHATRHARPNHHDQRCVENVQHHWVADRYDRGAGGNNRGDSEGPRFSDGRSAGPTPRRPWRPL